MQFIIENWFLIIAAIAILVAVIAIVIKFINLPTKNKLNCVKLWLLQAIASAERMYGTKSGEAKLSFVYDLFVEKFPTLARWVTYEDFKKMVEDALVEFKQILEKSSGLQEYVDPYAGLDN